MKYAIIKIYSWSKILWCLPNGKNIHNASRTKTVSQCQNRNIEHMPPQGKVHFSKFVIKPPTHPLTMDDVGASNGFFKKGGEIWKLAPKINSWRMMQCLFVYVGLNNDVKRRETLWNSQKSIPKTLTEDWWKSMKSMISKYGLWFLEENE